MQRSSSEAKSASERDQCSAEVWFPIWAARVYSSYMPTCTYSVASGYMLLVVR